MATALRGSLLLGLVLVALAVFVVELVALEGLLEGSYLFTRSPIFVARRACGMARIRLSRRERKLCASRAYLARNRRARSVTGRNLASSTSVCTSKSTGEKI